MADQQIEELGALSATPADGDLLPIVDVSDTTDDAGGTTKKITMANALGSATLKATLTAKGSIYAASGASTPAELAVGGNGQYLVGASGETTGLKYDAPGILPGGRLTLTSGTAITTADVTAAGTLYYAPYLHDRVRIYDGSKIREYIFAEVSLALTLTNAKNYDVFLYDNGGTLTLELSQAWTNDTTRADALAWQAGLGYVKSGTATRLWLGTIRASGTNATEVSEGVCFVWNTYNQVARVLKKVDTTDNWTYSTATWRQANNSSANQVAVICGLAGGSFIDLHCSARVANNTSTNRNVGTGIGVNSTSACSGQFSLEGSQVASATSHLHGRYYGPASLGYSYLAWLEFGGGADTQTWYGDSGFPANVQTGLIGSYNA